MKKYNIKVEEVKTTEFQLDAKNKKEALKMVEEIVFKTCILDLSCVEHKEEVNFIIFRASKKK